MNNFFQMHILENRHNQREYGLYCEIMLHTQQDYCQCVPARSVLYVAYHKVSFAKKQNIPI